MRNELVISNILLTRACPYKCDFCRIVKNYEDSPYRDVSSYTMLEPIKWIAALSILEDYGCLFHTIYGGEPALYPKLEELVMLLNQTDKCYTFITSGYNHEKWFDIQETHGIKGISASVDITDGVGDRAEKSKSGLMKCGTPLIRGVTLKTN